MVNFMRGHGGRGRFLLAVILFCLAVWTLPVVSAQPPFIASETDSGYIIEVPAPDALKQNTPYKLHLHIYNVTNGFALTNVSPTRECFVHIYNSTGNHQFTGRMLYDGAYDFEVMVAGGNFSRVGIYPYVTWCNSSSQGGFYRDYFTVTATGSILTLNNAALFGVGILALLALTVFSLVFATREENALALRLFFVMLSAVFLFGLSATAFMAAGYIPADGAVVELPILFMWVSGIIFIILLFLLLIGTIRGYLTIRNGKTFGTTTDDDFDFK